MMADREWCVRVLAAAALAVAPAGEAFAQRANENAAKAAEDAFGTSIGNESVGLYSPGDARGFSPVQAGNVRIEGLYFDQQTSLTSRVSRGSTVRVGIAAQAYPFPAPTGIADFNLRLPGDAKVVSGILTFGPYATYALEADGQYPIVPGRLSFGLGLRGTRFDNEMGDQNFVWNAGVVGRWRSDSGSEVSGFWSKETSNDLKQQPVPRTDAPHLPPRYHRRTFYGQSWTGWEGREVNAGTLAKTMIADWTLRAGLFRSNFRSMNIYSDTLLSTQPDGRGRHVISALPPQRAASTSGEARASRVITDGALRHTVHLAVRGRSLARDFGGAVSADFGTAIVGEQVALPRPDYRFGPTSRDDLRQGTAGVSYGAMWAGVGELSVGLQKTFYERRIAQPQFPVARSKADPWLYNATLNAAVSSSLTLYGSYTRGLEASGTAPSNARNAGEAMPPSLTRQIDAGFRAAITPRLRVVAGVFEVQKPYFNLDAATVFGPLGHVRNRGLEISVTGEIAPGLDLVAGMTLLQPRLSGEPVDRGIVGPVPIGPRPRYSTLSLTYRPAAWENFSIDLLVTESSARVAHNDNVLKLPAWVDVTLGARYAFRLYGAPAALRVRALNVTNNYGWTLTNGGGFFPRPARRVISSLTVDF